jgi:GntR family transcriptional regulator
LQGSIPLYHQLKSTLMQHMRTGEWGAGRMIPSESQLAEQYQMSRTTVRQAIGDLVSMGYLIRQQGKGTFVASRRRSISASRLYGFAEDLHLRGADVSVQVDSIAVEPCPDQLLGVLHVSSGQKVLTINRIARVNGIPVFRERSYLVVPLTQWNFSPQQDSEQFENIYGFFEQIGVKIALGRQMIRAEAATEQDASVLEIGIGEPVLSITRITQDESGSPVEYSEVRYHASRYEYEVNLLRDDG